MSSKKRITALCVIATLSLSTILLQVANASDFQSPRTSGLAGAGHAGPMLNDSIYLNPSFVSFLPSYSVSGNYLFYKGPTEGDGPADPHGHNLNVSLQDGRSEFFQAGVGFTLMEDRKVISFGASKAIVQRFGVGLGGKFVLPNVNAPSPIWDTVFSMTGVPWDAVQLAFVIDNLFESEHGRSYGLYREFILGMKFNVKSLLMIYVDPHYAPSVIAGDEFGHELGFEIPFVSDFFFRIGNFRNASVPWLNLRGKGYALGAGWIGPRMSLDASYHRTIEPLLATTYNFGMTVYF